MQNATPPCPDNDGDIIRFEKPSWLPDEKRAEIKAATVHHADSLVDAARKEADR